MQAQCAQCCSSGTRNGVTGTMSWRWLSVSHIATLGLVSLIVVAKYAGGGNTAGVGSTDLGLKVSRAKAQHDRT
jgi:hypothetical protein